MPTNSSTPIVQLATRFVVIVRSAGKEKARQQKEKNVTKKTTVLVNGEKSACKKTTELIQEVCFKNTLPSDKRIPFAFICSTDSAGVKIAQEIRKQIGQEEKIGLEHHPDLHKKVPVKKLAHQLLTKVKKPHRTLIVVVHEQHANWMTLCAAVANFAREPETRASLRKDTKPFMEKSLQPGESFILDLKAGKSRRSEG